MTITNSPALSAIERYYRFHSKIYDATRWSFLFGRTAIVQQVQAQGSLRHILEVGCGTGKNLVQLRRALPTAAITGLDLSAEMLAQARRNLGADAARVTLLQRTYDDSLLLTPQPDCILFSYSLSMFNPGWEAAIECAHAHLAPGGLIAVVDFHDTPVRLYRQWMERNHVRMNGHLLPHLAARFGRRVVETRRAYGGWWTYLIFIGEKKAKLN